MADRPSSLPMLTEDEMNAWIAFAASSQLVLAAVDQRLRADVNVAHAWYAIVAMLGSQPHRNFRQKDLAAVTGYSEARLSYMITQLETKGWLRRESHPTDGRTILVVLTDEGTAMLRAAAPGLAATIRESFLDALDDTQLAALREACRAVLMHLPGGEHRRANPVEPNRPD